ncbi:MAG: glycosyltransferase [Acidimicrobiales bacterium]
MRVLLASSLGGSGHLAPVAAVAQACRRLGHDALLVVPPSLAVEAERSGVPFQVGCQPSQAYIDGLWARVRAGGPDADGGLIDRELFADAATRGMLDAVRHARADWKADFVIREPCEYASAVAAQEAGIAQAQVGISLSAIEWGVLGMVEPIINTHSVGVAEAIEAAPYLSSFPASLDPSPWPVTVRFHTPTSAPATLPDWWPGDDRPLVYVTFGSVTGQLAEAVGVYRTALDAVASLPARVLLTVGRAVDIDLLGPVPANTHVEAWVEQSDVVARADLVVCHGGSGTTFGALLAGVPLVICPLFADQPKNAALVQAAGAGIAAPGSADGSGGLRGLGPADVAPLRETIERILAEPAYRQAAERISNEMQATPTLDDVIAGLLNARQ